MTKYIRLKRILFVSTVFVIFALAVFVLKASAAPLVNKAQTQEIQMILVHHGYSLKIDGIYGQKTEKAVRHWQKINGLFEDGVPGPITMVSLRNSIDGPANSNVVPAKRLNPPTQQLGLNGLPFAPPGLDNCAEMRFYRIQWELPEIFDQLGYRESRCRNDVTSSTGCCSGWLQNYISSHLSRFSAYRDRIINECQVNGRNDILGNEALQKQKQMCVTKVVFDISGLNPWSL